MRVGFDSDGCIENFHTGVKRTMDHLGHGHLWKSGPNPKSYWNYFEDWDWNFGQFKEVVDYGVDNRMIFCGDWYEHAPEAVRRIKDDGHTIVLITDRQFGSDPKNSHRNTIEAYHKADIPVDEIHFTADKCSVDVDCMVEDKLENYDALIANGTPTWLINREWNEVPGGDLRNRITSVNHYGLHVAALAEQGYADLTLV